MDADDASRSEDTAVGSSVLDDGHQVDLDQEHWVRQPRDADQRRRWGRLPIAEHRRVLILQL